MPDSSSEDNEIKHLLQQNQELLGRIYESTEKGRKYILWGRIMALVYLFLIVAPIIFVLIYLPPLVKGIVAPYQELLGDIKPDGSTNDLPDDGFLQRLLDEAQKVER